MVLPVTRLIAPFVVGVVGARRLPPALAIRVAAGITSIALASICLELHKEYQKLECDEANWSNKKCNELFLSETGVCAGAVAIAAMNVFR